jgi:hypothetical protein
MKNSFILFVILFPSIVCSQSEIILKNGIHVNAEISKVFQQAIQLDSLNNKSFIMFSVIDTIISSKPILKSIKNVNNAIDLDSIGTKYFLTFSNYDPSNGSDNKELQLSKQTSLFNFTVSPALNNTISTISLSNNNIHESSSVSFGLEYWSSLSMSILSGINFSYSNTEFKYKYHISDDFETVKIETKNILLGANLSKYFYLNQYLFVSPLVTAGILISFQNYVVDFENQIFSSSYTNNALFFETGSKFGFSFYNYDVFLQISKRWAEFDYVFRDINRRTKVYYSQSGLIFKAGIGYRI